MLASQNILNAATDYAVYTAPAGKTRTAFSITLTNRSASAVTANLALVAVGNGSPAADGSNYIEYGITIPANSSAERAGLVILTGQSVHASCSAANALSAVVYGIEE